MDGEGEMAKPVVYDVDGEILKRVNLIHRPWFVVSLAFIVALAAGVTGYELPHGPTLLPVAQSVANTSYTQPAMEDAPPEVEAPAGHPPLKIVVGANVYTIHYTTSQWLFAHRAGGMTIPWSQQIWLGRNIEWTALEERSTLLHELMHAAMAARGFQGRFATPGEQEDFFIESVTPALLAILRDNPDLVKWLQQ
jgi:hypothetical protein